MLAAQSEAPRDFVPVAWRAPFAYGEAAYRDFRPAGETLLDMVGSVPDLPARFWTHGMVCINGAPIARYDDRGRDLWKRTRPKAHSDRRPIVVTLHLPLGGGGGGNTAKGIGALVAAFALVVVTGGIASGAILGGLSSSIGAALGVSAATGANILAGAIGRAGGLSQ